MITARRFVARVACLALTLAPALAWMPDAWADDDDDKPADAAQAASGLSLTVEQQQAVGIALAHPVAARVGEQFEGLGLVLDPESLVADSGDLAAADAAARATRTEVLRLTGLYENGAGASLKMLEAGRLRNGVSPRPASPSAGRRCSDCRARAANGCSRRSRADGACCCAPVWPAATRCRPHPPGRSWTWMA